MTTVVVFHGTGCTVCHDEMEFLRHNRVAFIAKNVITDIEARDELLALGSKTLPTTVIDGAVVIGFDKDRLSQMLGI